MATTPLNTLKSWFETGDYPTQAQFWSWLESFWHKDEPIPMTAIAGLATILAGKATVQDIANLNQRINELESIINAGKESIDQAQDFSYQVPEGMILEKVLIVPTANLSLSIGTSDGGQEITPEQVYPANQPSIINLDWYALTNTDIYFTGVSAQTKFVFYKQ